ncbi:MAG: hypothetical protein JWO22_2337 [Frankiales bacterium]|nr:hypothetical protein [Frankiales bacterium]
MNDDQLITLLRDTPLPADAPDRYDAVIARRTRGDKRRTTVAAASLAVVALAGTVTAATWQGSPKAGPQSFLTSTTDAGTAKITFHVKDTTEFDGATGSIDFRHNALELTFRQGGKTAVMRTIGGDSWVSGPLAAQAKAPGKHWVHLPRNAAGAPDGFSQFNPSTAFARLEKQHATFTPLGTTTIDGVAVKHYRVTVPPDSNKHDVNAVEIGSSDDTGEVFVDDDGLVRRLAAADGSFVVDFTDFGAPVDIRPPAKSDTSELDTGVFTGSGSGSSTGLTQTFTTGTGSGSLSPAQKRAACAQLRPGVEADTHLTSAQKARLLEAVCGK